MKQILIELSPESCDAVEKELLRYDKEIRPKLDEICKRLAEIGAIEAEAYFAVGSEHGNGGVKVTVEPINNGYKIVASGHDVYFIEFGTGDMVSPHYNPSVFVAPGSWSVVHKQQYSTYGYWYYGGERLTGTWAAMPMYHAEKAIRANEKRIIEEVFKI